MQRGIEKKVEERAGEIKAGNNAIIIMNSRTGNIEQTVTIRHDLRDPLALLIAYAEQSGNQDAIDASKKLVAEAANAKPDKGKIFKLWNTVVAAIPMLVEIGEAVMKLVGAADLLLTSRNGTKRKCRNAPAISGAGGRPAVRSARRPQPPLTRN